MKKENELAYLERRIACLQSQAESHEQASLSFAKKAHRVREKLRACYKRQSELNNLELDFTIPNN